MNAIFRDQEVNSVGLMTAALCMVIGRRFDNSFGNASMMNLLHDVPEAISMIQSYEKRAVVSQVTTVGNANHLHYFLASFGVAYPGSGRYLYDVWSSKTSSGEDGFEFRGSFSYVGGPIIPDKPILYTYEDFLEHMLNEAMSDRIDFKPFQLKP